VPESRGGVRRKKIDKSVLAIGIATRVRDEKHRRFIASLPCCVCGAQPPTQAAHIRLMGAGGTGLKPGDDLCVPMCPQDHHQQHQIGEVTFWGGKFEAAQTLAAALYGITGDGLKGLRLVTDFRLRR